VQRWNLQLHALRLQVTRVAYRNGRRGFVCGGLLPEDVHRLELKIPPVVVVIIAGFLIWLGVSLVPAFVFRFPFQSVVALVIGLSGVVVSAVGVTEFKRAKTTVNPTSQARLRRWSGRESIGTPGTRCIWDLFLVLVGWTILNGSYVGFLVRPLFLLYMNRFQIKPEERALMAKYRDEFKAYCAEAPRWI
jgi:protein-S-isoprenylcysteine O-methyltransferase Ste14